MLVNSLILEEIFVKEKNYQNLEEKFDGDDYKSGLTKTLKSILKKVKSATTEATIASVIETEIHYFAKSVLGVDIIFDKEISQKDIKNRRSKFTGRLDAISNDLIIEYKNGGKLDSVKDQEKATKQVEMYLVSLKDKENIEYNAILTDGQKIRYFYYFDKTLHYTPFKEFEEEDLDKVIKSLVNVKSKKFVQKILLMISN